MVAGTAAIYQKIVENLKGEVSLGARALVDGGGQIAGAKLVHKLGEEVGGEDGKLAEDAGIARGFDDRMEASVVT